MSLEPWATSVLVHLSTGMIAWNEKKKNNYELPFTMNMDTERKQKEINHRIIGYKRLFANQRWRMVRVLVVWHRKHIVANNRFHIFTIHKTRIAIKFLHNKMTGRDTMFALPWISIFFCVFFFFRSAFISIYVDGNFKKK